MKLIIFVCHGSICRSPAAEFIAKNYLKTIKKDKDYEIISRAISHEEIGEDIYPPMKKELIKNNIPFERHYATFITEEDFKKADSIYYMDEENKNALIYYFGDNKKIKPIYQYSDGISYIEDPWYTGNFSKVISQIRQCIKDIFA